MTEDLNRLIASPAPSVDRPLVGLTVLVVEDSRFASEAMRLLCLRSGARIRRADRLRSAYRHLSTYRPGVVIVDLGLPDGSGTDLIRTIRQMAPPLPVVFGISGDPDLEQAALTAGADGFLQKPLASIAAFQQAILAALPAERRPQGLYALTDDRIDPDPLALRDDLHHVAEMLSEAHEPGQYGYLAQFLSGLARSSEDIPLARAAAALHRRGGPSADDLTRLSALMRDRIAAAAGF